MDNKIEHEPRQIEWLSDDTATAMDPASIWPSLTDIARHNPSVIAAAMIGARRTEPMPLNVPADLCGAEDRASPDKLPATLIRSLDGCICAWSHGMENRYGFTASQAVGLPSHQLLRTISCRTFDEINRKLLDQRTWSDGLVNRRSDGRPIMTASSCHLHRRFSDEAWLVTEVHADIVPSGPAVGTQVANVVAAITHEISEALTAAHLYTRASRRALIRAWPDRVLADQGLSHATEQIARATDTARLMRELAEQLRGLKSPQRNRAPTRLSIDAGE